MGERDEQKREAHVDLHIHSKFSDGNFSIEEIIEKSFHAKLKVISITDHDCIDAVAPTFELGKSLNIEVVPGVELSTELNGKDIHVLGYYLDYTHPVLLKKLDEFKKARFLRAKHMVERLNKMGLDLHFETVKEIAGKAAFGRPHIADALLKEELVNSFREAFEKYIGYDSPAYVEKMKFLPKEAFALIRDAGGVPILAHPQVTNCDENIPQFVEDGCMGLEVWHSEQSTESQDRYLKYCKENKLVYTGGSDCHGSRKGRPMIGSVKVPYECVELLKEAHEKNKKEV